MTRYSQNIKINFENKVIKMKFNQENIDQKKYLHKKKFV